MPFYKRSSRRSRSKSPVSSEPNADSRQVSSDARHGERYSRYSVNRQSPPEIKAIISVLIRKSRYGKRTLTKNFIRAEAERIDRGYDHVGKGDDLVRFLQNENVLSGSDREFALDCEQAVRVVAFCANEDADVAVAKFREAIANRSAEADWTTETEAPISEPAPPPSSPGTTDVEECESFEEVETASTLEPQLSLEPPPDSTESAFDPESFARFVNTSSRLESRLASLRVANREFDDARF
jgi:hypothetical protein